MGITLLDLYAITGLPISDKPYQESDFEGEEVAFEADPSHRNFYFPDNQVLGMTFVGVKSHDPLDYSDCFQHLYTLDASKLILNRMYPKALANKFMWCTTYSPKAMHLFEQAISIIDLRHPNDAGFELFAPNHFVRQLGLKQEIPFPLFESMNMYTSWCLKKKGKKQTNDPRFQPNFTQFKVKVRSISLLFASMEVSQTYNAWWFMICGELWTMDPLHLFRIIFANGRTLLPSQDQALFGEPASTSSSPALTSTTNQEPDIPKPYQPSSSQVPQKRRREEGLDSEDELEVPLIPKRRNATAADEDVTILDHDPEEDDHITLNELLHNILPGDSRTEASDVPEEVNDAQQQSETTVEEGGSLILLVNPSYPDHDNVPPVATPTLVSTTEDITAAHIESDEPRATAAAEETNMGENLAP
ncbi:hypothetical protein ACLB2K_038516 [Fragaria x ananassa]